MFIDTVDETMQSFEEEYHSYLEMQSLTDSPDNRDKFYRNELDRLKEEPVDDGHLQKELEFELENLLIAAHHLKIKELLTA